jgi:hypothetical protein
MAGPWYSARGDRLTDNLYSQISQENFNGAQERSVEGGSPSGGEDGEKKEAREGRVEGDTPPEENRNSYTAQVLSRLSIDQITKVAATLIAYVSNDVALEKWMNVEPDRVVSIAQRLLKKLTGAVAEEMAMAQDALVAAQEELEYVKGKASNMSQEIIAAEAAARADQIGLMEAQQENEQLQLEIEQQLASSNGQMLAAQQENDHLRLENDRLRGIVEELQAKVDEISGDLVTEVTRKEGRGRRSTMLRNEGNLQACSIVTAIKDAPLRVPIHPVLDKVWARNMEYIAQRAERNVGDEMQNRAPKAPLKPADLATYLTKLDKVIKEYRFTSCMGEKSENLFGYVLEVLSRGPSQRVALQDGLRSGKEEGGDVLVCMEKYHSIIDMAAENMTEDERKLMQAATGDDGDILVKIVEVAFVPESEALAKQMSGDERFHGAKEIGDKLAMGFTCFTLAVRIFAKTNILDVADDIFYIYDNRQELFVTQEARCLGAFRAFLEEYFTQLEAKHGRVTVKVMIQVFCLNAIFRDSKGDVVINACNRNFQQTGKYQLEGMDWRTMKPVVEDFIEDHIKYESIHGRHKIEARNRAPLKLKLLQNGDKDGAGGQRKKTVAMIAAEQNQLVLFAKKQEAGAKVCDDCGFTHSGPCTKKANEQAKLDRAAPFMQQIMNGKTEQQKKDGLTGLFQMIGANAGRGRGGGFKPSDKPGAAFGGAGRGAQGGAGRGARTTAPQGGAGRGAQGAAQGGAARGSIQTYDELSPQVKHLAFKKGFCLKFLTKEGCSRGTDCKFGHPLQPEIQQLKREAAALKKEEAAVALTVDKKSSAAPVMTAQADVLALMTEILNEAAMADGAGPISKARGEHFGLNCLAIEEALDVPAIRTKYTLNSSVDRGVKGAPRARKLRMWVDKKHVRSDNMVLESNEILPEGAGEEGEQPKKKVTRYHAFHLLRLATKGRWRRFSKPDVRGYVTVLKGAKKDANQNGITMPVFSATYTGNGYNQRVKARSAEWERKKAAEYDRNHLRMLERRAEQKAQERVMRKAKLASNEARLSKIYKAGFDKLWAQNTTAQAEDKRKEREGLRNKQKGITAKMMTKRFLVDMNEKKCMHEFGAPFQFARSKMPNRKTWANVERQVEADWSTRKKLTRKWQRILERRLRHRKLQMGKPGFRLGERMFMCSKRATAMDGVYGQHVASLWRPIVAGDMLGYYSIVPGIGVGTGTFVVWSKRMPPAADGRLRYDPPGRFSQWPEPLELQGHAFGFDWWKNAVLRARAYNCQDNAEQVRVEARMPPRQTTVSVHAEVNSIKPKVMCESDAKATESIGRLKPEWEYLFVPSRRQRGRDKSLAAWRLAARCRRVARLLDVDSESYNEDDYSGSDGDNGDDGVDDHSTDISRVHEAITQWSDTQESSNGSVTDLCVSGMLADTMTRQLSQIDFERVRVLLHVPEHSHPLSSVMRMEPYRYFDYDEESQQYRPAFMGVQCEATAFLSTVGTQVSKGIRLHLVDSGSSVFTSPHKDTMILPIKTTLKLTGIGGATSDLMSPLIYSVLDVNGEYVVLHYQAVYYLPTVPIALFATGPFEQQGWTFHLNAQAPCMTKTGGACVPLFKDRVTGFHWLLERTHAAPTILGRRELVHQLATKPNLAGVAMAYKPALDSAEQRTLMSAAEPKPVQGLTQYEYDSFLDQFRLGGGNSKALVNTRDKARLQSESDQIGKDALQNLWKKTIEEFNQRKVKESDKSKTGDNAEEPKERFLHHDYEGKEEMESADTKPREPIVKEESDDVFFKKERKEKQSTPQTRPIRLKIPRSRFYDSCQPKDIQKQQRFIHETLGHLSLGTIKKGLMEAKGYESIANVIDTMADDQHCTSCALGKVRMPPTPTGKTIRPTRKVVSTKMYVDLSGYIEEASIYSKFHYYISAVTDEGFAYFRGLRLKSQALMGLAKIFAESGTPRIVQIDGEGALANDVAADWFASKQIHVVQTEAGQHFRNGHVECRHRIWKSMARPMIERAGFSIDWWFLAIKHAVLITNLILLESVEPESNKAKGIERRRSAWEAHYGEPACLESYLLGPFGCLAFLILTAEQRRARGLSGHFGDRSLQGLYLGCQVDGSSGVFKHLFTDGRTIFATPHALKVVPDVYPLRLENPRKGPIISIDDVDMERLEADGEVTLAAFTSWMLEGRAEKEREVQLYLSYRRDSEMACDAAESQNAGISLPAINVKGIPARNDKTRRPTRLIGDDRRTGNNRKRPHRLVAMEGDGEANHRRWEEKHKIETEPMRHPGHVDLLEELPEEMTFSRPYEGARYELAECTDFSQEHMVPSGVKDPFGRFAGRKVRRWFESTNPKERQKMTASEGVVVKYNKQRATFRIRYQGFERKMDVEDVDMSTLEDILIMGPKYGDQRAEWGKTRDECRRAAVYAVIMQEAWEEITHNNVPYYNQTEESQLGGAACYAATEGKPVIFDDEPRNPSELAKHPEKEDILVSAAKEIEQLIEMEIGVEVTPAEVRDVVEKGHRILQCKMVYKRKYVIENGKERFLKWKSRLAVVGSSEREGWETVYSTFSPTVAFSAIRLLISFTVDPRFSVESYDLSGAFLGTELRDRAVYIKLPKDAGIHAGKVLLLKKSVYGLKTSGRDFIHQLAEQILSFLVPGKGVSYGFKRLLIDQCVFRYEDGEGNVMILLHYVDDLVIATTSLKVRDLFLAHINRKWKTTAEGKLNRYLGINYRWDEATCSCTATATAYIERIAARFGLEETRLPDSPMDAGFEMIEDDFNTPPTEEMVSLYRSLIGSIGYAATTVRFDVSYGLSVLSRFLAKPNDKLINAAKRIIKYLVKTKDLGITWKITPEDRKAGFADMIFGAVDASFAMDPITRRSHAGFVTFCNHGLVSWRSKLQSIVTLSSAEAEYVALADFICEVKYLRELARGLGFGQTEPTLIYEDNRAAILTAEAECSAGGRLRHVDIKYRFTTEAIRNGEVRIRYIPTNLQFADIMTKALVPKKHKDGVELIVNAKDAYRIVAARREMAEEKYEESYFIIQQHDEDGIFY